MGIEVSIIIPVYNEEKYVGEVISKIKNARYDFDYETIVVSDGSTDKTNEVLRKIKGIKLIFYKQNRGKGYAVRKGIKEAEGKIIVIQDADLEYDPKDIPILIKGINENHPVVYGSRFLGKKIKIFGKGGIVLPIHYIGNRFLTLMTNLLYGSNLTDMETCFKAFKTHTLKNIKLKANRFELEPEITAKFLKNGYKIKEIPITHTPRRYEEGKKIKKLDGLKAFYYILKYRLFN